MGAEREGIWEDEEGQWLTDLGNQNFCNLFRVT